MRFISLLGMKHFEKYIKRIYSMRYVFLALCFASLSLAQEIKYISLEDLLQQMLKNNSKIASSLESITYQEAGLEIAKGQFDTNIELYVGGLQDTNLNSTYRIQSYPGLKQDYTTQSYNYGANLKKILENGTSMEFGLSSNYTKSQSTSHITDTSEPASIQNKLSFSLSIPLLKNAGTDIATTGLESAKQNILKSKYTLAHVISTVSNEVINSYWNYFGAHEKYQITLESESLARILLNNSEKLFLKDAHPKSEIKYSLANLHAKRLQTNLSKDALRRQWSTLINLAGLTNQYKVPQVPETTFPKNTELTAGLEQRLIQDALRFRYDLKTYAVELEYLNVLRRYYYNQLKPDLALNVGVDYKFHTQQDGVAQMLDYGSDTSKGNKIYANLMYKFAIDNSKAEGEYAQALSKYTDTQLSKDDLIRSIEITIVSLMQTLNMIAEQINISSETIELYKETVENEQKKYSLGISTVNDVITIQNNLVGAKMTHVDLQLSYATTLTNLLFQSGRLVQEQNENHFSVTNPIQVKGF